MEIPPRMNELLYAPAVFVVNDNYQIMAIARSEIIFWITVGDENYYDHSNGIMRSLNKVHRVNVPIKALDAAGEYTVHYRRVIERKAYSPLLDPEENQTFKFRGIPKEGPIKIYHIADTHSTRYDGLSTKATKYFGDDLDLLILNGDVLADGKEVRIFEVLHKYCEAMTGGSRPCIYSRGNHEIRGFCAEKFEDYAPTYDGKSYFTFCLGRLWGIVLDVGEDKLDTHPVYNGTNASTQFRKEQTKFIDKVIENANTEYNAPGVEYRIVVSHVPFSRQKDDPVYNPDPEIFADWCKKLKDDMKVQAMLCGHIHQTKIYDIGGSLDVLGQPCPVVIGGRAARNENNEVVVVGGAYTLEDNKMKVEFTTSELKCLEEHVIDFNA